MPRLDAKPEPIEVDFRSSAIVVVDMQNAFASKGGMLDLAGVDISGAARVVTAIRAVLTAARPAGMCVVYLQMGYKPDLSNAGGPGSPNPKKELAMCMMGRREEWKGKLLTEGSWDFALVDELAPHAGDLVIVKTRYSGFAGTSLDAQLRARGIRHLFFTGIATNVCVESTLRDAYFLEYWPVIVGDCTMQAGPPSLQEATMYNVECFLGWSVTSETLLAQLSEGGK
ncbi:MAG TPA: cysteine hydrolase [Candidatus Acidoferrales bacterium]|nr:cysteine hydrolase [Candidatus Acidoferrales bacterium]